MPRCLQKSIGVRDLTAGNVQLCCIFSVTVGFCRADRMANAIRNACGRTARSRAGAGMISSGGRFYEENQKATFIGAGRCNALCICYPDICRRDRYRSGY